ncbi:TerC family protein [Aureimonas flava]|uniref:TerC family protein n=1 Tax=Aureimonas flava TaxID=2320271 RepID=A0A3A1WGB4_9HYPH|nr:TerC family protein [Aureimonas flava]RIX99187.1 TerC family protein [Aureimonas flava]
MFELLTPEGWLALGQIIIMDVVLAGDNAIVIGLAVAGLPADQRKKAIFWGIAAATLLRIAFTVVATQLLGIFGLLLAGGVLLLWVCWKMWTELRAPEHDEAGEAALEGAAAKKRKTLGQATTQIILADVSMSLDNVIAVAGAAEGHHWTLLAFGLLLSIALMAVAANFIAKLLNRHRWIAYVGLAVILFVAVEMVLKGLVQVYPPIGEYIPFAVEDTAHPALPVGAGQGGGEPAATAAPAQ